MVVNVYFHKQRRHTFVTTFEKKLNDQTRRHSSAKAGNQSHSASYSSLTKGSLYLGFIHGSQNRNSRVAYCIWIT